MKGRGLWVVGILYLDLYIYVNYWVNRFGGKRKELVDRKFGFGKRGLGLLLSRNTILY